MGQTSVQQRLMLEESAITMEKKSNNRPSSAPQKQNGPESKKAGEKLSGL